MNGIISTNNLLVNVPAMLLTSGNVVNPVRRIGMSILTRKHCPKCGEDKPVSEFGKDKNRAHGLSIYCKKCACKNTAHYYALNPKHYKQKAHERYKKNIVRVLEYCKKWAEDHHEKRLEIGRKWDHANRDYSRVKTQNRRAKIKGNGGTITKAEWLSLLDKYGHKCIVPGCNRTDITMDHVVPVELGGSNTIDNIQPLCAHHNSSKGAKIMDYR
jgi:hypothetical protein